MAGEVRNNNASNKETANRTVFFTFCLPVPPNKRKAIRLYGNGMMDAKDTIALGTMCELNVRPAQIREFGLKQRLSHHSIEVEPISIVLWQPAPLSAENNANERPIPSPPPSSSTPNPPITHFLRFHRTLSLIPEDREALGRPVGFPHPNRPSGRPPGSSMRFCRLSFEDIIRLRRCRGGQFPAEHLFWFTFLET